MATEDPTAERWLPVVGMEDAYEVSSAGRVRSLTRIRRTKHGVRQPWPRKMLTLSCASGGYLRVTLCKDAILRPCPVHRLVLETFDRPPLPGEQANHKNFDKQDNRIENLEWVTPLQNTQHAEAGGRRDSQRGSASHLAKLEVSDIPEIRRRVANGSRHWEVAADYGVTRAAISHIIAGRNWRHF